MGSYIYNIVPVLGMCQPFLGRMLKCKCEDTIMRLKEIRIENGKTQQDIVNYLHCSYNKYASWEQGRTQPSIEDLIILADYFNVTIDYLVGRESEDGLVVPDGQSLSGDEKELLDGFRRLNAAGKGRILGNLEGLLQASALFTDKTAK